MDIKRIYYEAAYNDTFYTEVMFQAGEVWCKLRRCTGDQIKSIKETCLSLTFNNPLLFFDKAVQLGVPRFGWCTPARIITILAVLELDERGWGVDGEPLLRAAMAGVGRVKSLWRIPSKRGNRDNARVDKKKKRKRRDVA